jgi:hypothetical protein
VQSRCRVRSSARGPSPQLGRHTERNMTRINLPVLVAALTLLLASCGPRQGLDGEPFATISIINDSAMQVNIHALRNGTRLRVGTVPGITTENFPLRRDMLSPAGELRLVIDPIGSPRAYPATPIVVIRGDVIELRVSSFIR